MVLRYVVMALISLPTFVSGPPRSPLAGVRIASAAAASRVSNIVNAITITNKSGAAIRRYPLQFGRPFIEGAIPHAPAILVNGVAVPSQADVKNRYPDGSVEYAVMAVVVPTIPANGSVTLSFADTTANSNAPLTSAQMLDPAYNFDAQEEISVAAVTGLTPTASAAAPGGSLTFNSQTISFGPNPASGGYPILINGVANGGATNLYVLNGNLYAVNSSALWFEWSGTTWAQTTNPRIGNTPAVNATADARTMLQNGDYKLWTSGPVAQTIILGDDSPARKYDIGFGDGFHPFRPRFEATFWPATHQVFVRAIGENDLTTELEDIAYNLTITGGQASPATEDGPIAVSQGALTKWTKSFWLPGSVSGAGSGTPNPQVDIDNNLAYLESTRFVPNYDPSLTLSAATIASDYANWWTNTSHDIGGTGAWQPGMGTTGGRPDIAPEPAWDAAWLYGGTWQLRQVALGNADLAGSWPMNTRETDPTRRLNRADPKPVAPAVGSGYGEPVSVTDRLTMGQSASGEGAFIYGFGDGNPADQMKAVGPINLGRPWEVDNSHEPSPFFVPYILTGDPFYLDEMENWANYDETTNAGAQASCCVEGRGPTGDEGGSDNQLRGDAWILRSRAEAAFAAPDGDPEKQYLTILTQEYIARWEGALGVTGTVFDGSAEKVWAQQTGDPESSTSIGPNDPPPPAVLGNWQANYGPSLEANWLGQGILIDNTLNSETATWMQWYTQYAVGRAAELGFAAGPLAAHTSAYLIGVINSAYPMMISNYVTPVSNSAGFLPNWAAIAATFSTKFLTSTNPADFPNSGSPAQAPLAVAFAANDTNGGYDMLASAALSPLVDEGVAGAAHAETWMQANVYQPLVANGNLALDPSWAIVPRTDANALPPQPTTPQ